MLVLKFITIVLFVTFGCLFLVTQKMARDIDKRFPPIGSFKTIDGVKLHYVDRPADGAQATTVVYLHGASGNLRDPLFVYGERLDGEVRQIFVDRPGQGWSESSGRKHHSPKVQGQLILGLLDALDVEKAVFVAHSFSGTIATTLAVLHPERVAGLLLVAPVSHPWPGGVNWYYHVASSPIIGWLFSNTLSLPIGLQRLDCATRRVFWPNRVPDYYAGEIGNDMVLVPRRFRANSMDVAMLREYVVAMSPRYGEISAPSIVVTGDKDQVVFSWVHTDGLERDVAGIRRITLKETGHMPHHAKPDLMVEAVRALVTSAQTGKPVLLDTNGAVGSNKGDAEHVGCAWSAKGNTG